MQIIKVAGCSKRDILCSGRFYKISGLVQIGFVLLAILYLYVAGFKAGIKSFVSAVANFIIALRGRCNCPFLSSLKGSALGILWIHVVGKFFIYQCGRGGFGVLEQALCSRRVICCGNFYSLDRFFISAEKVYNPVIKSFAIVILIWFVVTIPSVFTGGRFYGHYFIQILLPLCTIAGVQFRNGGISILPKLRDIARSWSLFSSYAPWLDGAADILSIACR